MPEQMCKVGDVELAYEAFGNPAHPAMLLIMGLGTQMIAWPEDFCQALVDRGFYVIRFDNRDCGRSTRIFARPPTLLQLLLRDSRTAAYTLDDMADDAAGLLAGLGIDAAHVAGASLGGMIAQTLAVRHPDRVLSLVSIMSTTGHWRAGRASLRMYPALLRRPPADRERYVEYMTSVFGVIGSPGFERDPEDMRRLAARSFDRGHHPAGTGRQLAAILASGDRSKQLRRIRVPTLVIHGEADRLVNPSGARATAAAIPGARLVLIPGMGHDLPRGAWPDIIDGIVDTARRAGFESEAAA
jgi:pimeloyl-ACP methyl ester carboxylesterase